MPYQQGPTVWHNNIFTAILCSWQNLQEDTEISQLLSALTNAWSFSLSISFNKMVQFVLNNLIFKTVFHSRNTFPSSVEIVKKLTHTSWLRICLQCRRPGFDSWVGKIPWRRKWQPTPVFLPGESHGQRSLAGYSIWGHTESGMIERD